MVKTLYRFAGKALKTPDGYAASDPNCCCAGSCPEISAAASGLVHPAMMLTVDGIDCWFGDGPIEDVPIDYFGDISQPAPYAGFEWSDTGLCPTRPVTGDSDYTGEIDIRLVCIPAGASDFFAGCKENTDVEPADRWCIRVSMTLAYPSDPTNTIRVYSNPGMNVPAHLIAINEQGRLYTTAPIEVPIEDLDFGTGSGTAILTIPNVSP